MDEILVIRSTHITTSTSISDIESIIQDQEMNNDFRQLLVGDVSVIIVQDVERDTDVVVNEAS